MTGLLTFHWADDCGALLQAYALKHSLEQLGATVELIPYVPFRLIGRYWWCPLNGSRLPNGRIKYWINRPAWKRNLALGVSFWRRKRAMRAFRRVFLPSAVPVRRSEKLSFKSYSLVIVGSDQVWNPGITVTLDNAYIGNVGDRGKCRLVSYAASLGGSGSLFLTQDKETFIYYVGGHFTDISTRERSAADFLETLLHRKVENVVDPVLLLHRKDWEPIVTPPMEDGYILLHSTEYHEGMAQFTKELARQLGKIVIQTSLPIWNGDWVTPRPAGGPKEFLGYLQNASCVVTNSFHATAFSVLFEKPFLVFRHSAYHARLEGLLETLGLTGRFADGVLPPERMFEKISWPTVRERLEAERSRSLGFLRRNLEKRSLG